MAPRKFRDQIMGELRAQYYAEERERDDIAKVLEGMGWIVDEKSPTGRPQKDSDYFAPLTVFAFEHVGGNPPSLSITWERGTLRMQILSDSETLFKDEEFDVAMVEASGGNSGAYDAVLGMVKDALNKLANR